MARLRDRLAQREAGAALVIGAQDRLNAPVPAALGAADPGPVALCIHDPVALIKTLIALDGSVARLILLSHALAPDTVAQLLTQAGCKTLVTDRTDLDGVSPDTARQTLPGPAQDTTWVLTTSGTTGLPKLIPHTLNSLTRTVARGQPAQEPHWGLVYDPTRFAGMQVVLQALIGGGVLIAPDLTRPLGAQITALAEAGCSHLSATPTLWRRLLMAPELKTLPLRQITLGGEIVDQQVLDSLRAMFPDTRITHIYASTEAGVGFAVTDGQAGFPARYLQEGPVGISMKLVEDILWLRPPTGARRSLDGTGVEVDADGFIRSGDRIRIDGDRALFLGRDNGTINVGGVKIHPEVVEQVIAAVPGVELVRITSKKSPIAGALVVAEVLATPGTDTAALKPHILTTCRDTLDREAVPAILRFVDDLTLNAAGKLIRTNDPG